MLENGPVLVINAGSSTVKYAVYDRRLSTLASGQRTLGPETPDHGAAINAVLANLASVELPVCALGAAAHRVVHGGTELAAPTRITAAILDQIRACSPLAPLHNPHNIRGIEILAEQAPELPQYASFDTGFHATNPEIATRYAVPDDWHKSNIRRFGFHGISYQALVANFPGETPEKLLGFHLGNGASICAIQNGNSVATTMGYSPLEGLTMGTRSGSIDAAAVLQRAAQTSPADTLETLNQRSGLFALSGGIFDMQSLLASNSPAAGFAIDHFCYWAARHAGSMIAAMGGVDAIAFTGGIGENAAPIRDQITTLLGWTNVAPADIHIIPAREERQIAQNALSLMNQSQ